MKDSDYLHEITGIGVYIDESDIEAMCTRSWSFCTWQEDRPFISSHDSTKCLYWMVII